MRKPIQPFPSDSTKKIGAAIAEDIAGKFKAETRKHHNKNNGAIRSTPPGENWLPAGQSYSSPSALKRHPSTRDYRYIIQVEENGTEHIENLPHPQPSDNAFFDLSEVVEGTA